MLNQVIIVGQVRQVIYQSVPKEEKIVVEVSRTYKNKDGIYENDMITVYVPEASQGSIRYDMLVGIKGSIECLPGESMKIVAQKISFLTTKESPDAD